MTHNLLCGIAIFLAQLVLSQNILVEVALGNSVFTDSEKYKPNVPGMVHSITNCNAHAAHVVFNEKDIRCQ